MLWFLGAGGRLAGKAWVVTFLLLVSGRRGVGVDKGCYTLLRVPTSCVCVCVCCFVIFRSGCRCVTGAKQSGARHICVCACIKMCKLHQCEIPQSMTHASCSTELPIAASFCAVFKIVGSHGLAKSEGGREGR